MTHKVSAAYPVDVSGSGLLENVAIYVGHQPDEKLPFVVIIEIPTVEYPIDVFEQRCASTTEAAGIIREWAQQAIKGLEQLL